MTKRKKRLYQKKPKRHCRHCGLRIYYDNQITLETRWRHIGLGTTFCAFNLGATQASPSPLKGETI